MTKEEEAPITVENEDEVVNVLASLRQEYKDLNDRYKALLAYVYLSFYICCHSHCMEYSSP
jgi:hypothetical protein